MSDATKQQIVVTGAFGYTGKYITRLLLAMGKRVRTLTGHPNRPNEFGDRIEVAPLNFSDRDWLTASLRGAECLINTYWVRFNYGRETFDQAVENTKTLIAAAKDAGVRKLVHISISNPTLDSPLPYFRGKAEIEAAIQESGLRYAILRPTVIFGFEDILINNIAWLLRHFPAFAIPGSGEYRVQPIFVEDVAELAALSSQEETDGTRDAVGPEIFTFNELVRLIAAHTQSRAKIVHVPPSAALLLSNALGAILGDRILTEEEIQGLMAGLLVSAEAPTGCTRFSDWLKMNSEEVGREYSSELARHYARKQPAAT
ncbi:MAG: NAD-dependent epimerase/dehydratase family protein [Candidatus Acidiferrales bacterium]